ncbi:MAG: ornithine carbamoyltransferase [Immundisolibacteraceae bacterium]|nr:ornithine carbamoyltransferase [Immundisolibacteraceae bacterium]
MTVRHFLTLKDLSPTELKQLIIRAGELKAALKNGQYPVTLKRQVMGMIFEKSSTRTRISFETGMAHFGGHALFLSPRDTQLGRGESIEDSARVISRMVDIVVIRTTGHDRVEKFAAHSQVPVINALTDSYHPCQLLADMLTWQERRGDITGRRAVWIGDGNNVCHSWMNAAQLFDFELDVITPESNRPNETLLAQTSSHVNWDSDPGASKGADLVVTDTWASMGQEDEKNDRAELFKPYQVDQAFMQSAASDALFMHCLPAYRGQEVTAEVIDGPQSVVWDEAENRLHAQKALVELLLS